MAAGCLSALALAWLSWRLPVFPGQRSLLLSLLSMAWWTGMVSAEHASSQPLTKMFWSEMAWLGVIGAPTYWGLFVWNYIYGRFRPALQIADIAVALVAMALWAVALTNSHHHLIYTSAAPVGTPPFMTMNYVHGPLYIELIVVFALIMLLCDLAFIYEIIRSSRIYRAHYAALLLCSLPPWISNMLYATALFKVGGADLTPLSFMITFGVLYWLLSRRYISDLLPIAQGTLLSALPDPVLVLDGAQRIAECNPAALRLAGDGSLVGRPIGEVQGLRDSLAALDPAQNGPREIAIGTPPRYFDVGDVALGYGGRSVGRLILLREISHRKEAEFRLQAAHAELERQLQANLGLQQQLREQAIRDGLTGLHNRRFFDEVGPVLLADAERTRSPLALAMIDIDLFKRLNDSHGHQAGDAMLRMVGAFLRQSVRQGDMVFRLGGEEFLVLLPHAAGEDALRRLDEWRALFAGQAIEHGGKRLAATFSAGLALYPDDGRSIGDLLHRADQALYQAKAQGRNKALRWA